MKQVATTALALVLGTAALATGAMAQPAGDPVFSKTRIGWNKPFKPFHVIGNIYYVGPAGVSAFLITTPQGHILTDGGLPESTALIERNIAALGFKITDVKILLNSHAHFDHSGGLAKLKADSGAKLVASAGDAPILQSGHIAFGPAQNIDTTPVKVDRVVKDGESIALGRVTMIANVTPGHTPGCTTWTYKMPPSAFAGEKNLDVMFFCSISVAGNPLVGNTANPQIVSEYRASFARLKKMKADVFLAPHGGQFGLEEKVARMKPGGPNPFLDPGELPRFIAQAEKDFAAELAGQTAKTAKAAHP